LGLIISGAVGFPAFAWVKKCAHALLGAPMQLPSVQS
jgi:hypothetical protein